ncbi:PilZ domain-containing protein [Pseudomonas sp. Gutcm_11s]|uniref:PilZ domain-containing protein n=1 Tax=Pseudomonas sp. Gutcm_11s TaxID=3026088 RepID=UPI002360FBF9|nr:PilZ domain-containing protein [Pseudomonas sp. Gutcm_11s]MDD0841353.1 PilZ domain-containing protein [Pseudomonas sp. Gutcm_11s]
MSEQPTLSSEELDFIREVFSSQLIGKPLSIPAFKVDGGPLANALLARLGGHAKLSLEAQVDNCRMTFPLQMVDDELHGLLLEMGAPSIFEDGQVRRPWRLELDEPLVLRDKHGEDSALLVYEIAPDSLVVGSPMLEPPERFSLWLPLPGFESLPIKGQRIRRIGRHRAAYGLQMQHSEHAERIRQFIFEQYRQQHPQLQIAR